jgi:hypothetical protein
MAAKRALIARSVAVVVASATTIACSLFALDGFSGEDVPHVDADGSADGGAGATSDAGTEAAASDAGGSASCGVAAGNLLVGQNEGFEDGCALWQPDRASLSATTTASCGKQACRLCPYYSNVGNAFFTPAGVTMHAGERYVFSLKIRREGDVAPIEARTALAIPAANAFYDGTVPIMTDWGVSTATLEVGAGGEGQDIRLGIYTSGATDGGACVLVDEATLVRTKDAGQ